MGVLGQTTTFLPLFLHLYQIPNPIINLLIIHLTHNRQRTHVTCVLGMPSRVFVAIVCDSFTLLDAGGHFPFTQVTVVQLSTIDQFVTVDQLLTIPPHLYIS